MNDGRTGVCIFAFSLLLDDAVMADRCPTATFCGRARLPDHRFELNRYGVPTLRPAAASSVFGVLWLIGWPELTELDHFEGADRQFTARRLINVVDERGFPVRAEAYIPVSTRRGLPGHDCLHAVIRAASRRALPEAYIKELQCWLEKVD